MSAALRPLASLALTILIVVWLVAPPAAHAQDAPAAAPAAAEAAVEAPLEPTPTAEAAAVGSAGPTGLTALIPDPRRWVVDVFNHAIVLLLQGLTSGLRAVVGAAMSGNLNFVTQTPPGGSYASPTVQGLWGVVRGIANLGLVLVALAGGINLIFRAQIGEPYHDVMELLPRLAIGGLMANTSLWWAQLAIDANNAMSAAVGQATLPAWEHADGFSQRLMDVIAALIYLVTSLLLVLQMLMRLALIDVLIVVSPLALLCWVLPQTEGWTRLWSNTFVAVVFTQFVQVLTLKLGGSLMTELAPMAPGAAVLALFLGVAVLALTLKVPALMRSHVGSGLGFARYHAYRGASRALDGLNLDFARAPGRQLRLPGL